MRVVICLPAIPMNTHFSLFLTTADPFIYGFLVKTPDPSYPNSGDLPFSGVLTDGDFM